MLRYQSQVTAGTMLISPRFNLNDGASVPTFENKSISVGGVEDGVDLGVCTERLVLGGGRLCGDARD